MQMRDPVRAQVISPNDPDLIMASTFDGEGKNITFTLPLANQMKESAPRRILPDRGRRCQAVRGRLQRATEVHWRIASLIRIISALAFNAFI
jgi:hypothetical protein